MGGTGFEAISPLTGRLSPLGAAVTGLVGLTASLLVPVALRPAGLAVVGLGAVVGAGFPGTAGRATGFPVPTGLTAPLADVAPLAPVGFGGGGLPPAGAPSLDCGATRAGALP